MTLVLKRYRTCTKAFISHLGTFLILHLQCELDIRDLRWVAQIQICFMIFSNILVSCADSCKQNLIFIRNVRGEIESFFMLLQILSQHLSFGIYNFSRYDYSGYGQSTGKVRRSVAFSPSKLNLCCLEHFYIELNKKSPQHYYSLLFYFHFFLFEGPVLYAFLLAQNRKQWLRKNTTIDFYGL